MSTRPPNSAPETAVLADHERWYAALAYALFLCFLGMWRAKQSEFIRFHARQGFLLFLAECVSLLGIIVVDQTIGRVPFIGLLIVILLQIVVYLSALFLSVTGFVKALFGERWIMPFLGGYTERVPLL